MTCPFCKRDLPLTQHHVVPKEFGGTETVSVCADCHNAIHARYSNKELRDKFYAVEMMEDLDLRKAYAIKLLTADSDLRRAYKFLSKQSSLKRFRNKQSNKRRRKGKYG